MKDNTQGTADAMDAFSGWETPEDVNIFDGNDGSPDGSTSKPEPANSAEPADTDADDTPPADADDTTKTDDDIDFFGETDIEDDEAEGDEPDAKGGKKGDDVDAPQTSSTISTLNALKAKGLLDYELDEDEELTEERAEELLEDGYEASIDNKLGELMKGLPPLTQQLIKFAANGGDERTFLTKALSQPSLSISKDMDLEDDKQAELVVKTQLRADGHDDDYIEANLEFLKDSGKLKGLAKTLHPKILAKDEAERQAELTRVSQQKETVRANQRKFKTDLTSTITGLDEVSGFKLSKKEKQELPSYMADPVIPSGNNKVSQFQKDLYDAMQDKNTAVLLAKLVKNKFDFSEIARTATTKKVKDIRDDVRRSKNTKSSGGSQPAARVKNLADYF